MGVYMLQAAMKAYQPAVVFDVEAVEVHGGTVSAGECCQ